jgi:cation diffusion facilitator family transporter
MHMTSVDRSKLTRFAWLSIAAAVVTIGLKTGAYLLTGSVGLLSDALESLVNLAGAVMALTMLTIATRPPDDDHPHGHSKAEYFSSGVEGTLIMVAAVGIAVAAVERLLHPRALEQIGLGLAVSVVASLVNLGVALVLMRASKHYDSITLQANARHLLTDVWTSAGVVVGVGAVALTGWKWLDPAVALLVAANIVWTGVRIVRDSVLGLMDTAMVPMERAAVQAALDPHLRDGVQSHALLTRQAGSQRFVSLHVLVPGAWTVQQGHDLVERIEADIRSAVRNVTVLTHLESLDDPASWDDVTLERRARPAAEKPPAG